MWIKSIQFNHFQLELRVLKSNNSKPTPRVVQFGLFLDSGNVIRCHGRLGNSTLQLASKIPILLPATDRFVELHISEIHKTKHSGTTEVVLILREEYWVLQSVKKILQKCVTCKRFEGLPYAPQIACV